MKIEDSVQFILNELEVNGYEGFIVGGSVRDFLLGTVASDIDIATSAKPNEIMDIFEKTYESGIKHGTITVIVDDKAYELTTYRFDLEYRDHRRPNEIVFASNLEEDLKRRDFTMNAMAFNPKTGLIDPFGGHKDIQKSIIRAVGDADERFFEDSLRMLRAIRFAAELAFEIEEKTYQAIAKNAKLISYVSMERVKQELDKMLLAKDIAKIKILWDSKLIKHLGFNSLLNIDYKKAIIDISNSEKDLEIRYTLLMQDLSFKEARSIMKNLKFDNKSLKNIANFIKNFDYPFSKDSYKIKKAINYLEIDGFFRLIKILTIKDKKDFSSIVEIANRILENNEAIFLDDLEIDGAELISLGMKEGKIVGECLNYLLNEVLLDNSKNEKACLVKMAKLFESSQQKQMKE